MQPPAGTNQREIKRPGALAAGLNHHSGIALYKLAQWGQGLFDEALSSLGFKTRHFAVLANLARDPSQSQQALGTKLGIDRSTMVKVTDDLERLGFVERRPHPGDRRAHTLVVSAGGRQAADEAERLLSEVETAMFAPLTDSERETFRILLGRLLDPATASREGPHCNGE